MAAKLQIQNGPNLNSSTKKPSLYMLNKIQYKWQHSETSGQKLHFYILLHSTHPMPKILRAIVSRVQMVPIQIFIHPGSFLQIGRIPMLLLTISQMFMAKVPQNGSATKGNGSIKHDVFVATEYLSVNLNPPSSITGTRLNGFILMKASSRCSALRSATAFSS